jgi:ribonuclease R
MRDLQRILEKKREKRGAIEFDFPESKIKLDKLGKPVEVSLYPREISNKIIEEFMLVCNETVSEHMFWTHMPFIYRVHEEPDEEKLKAFTEFSYNLGYPVKLYAGIQPKSLQEVLKKVEGKKEEPVLSKLLLRSMMQARYAPENIGHFGLAATYYSHFTSPIRRYPDLLIHRIIKEFLHGKIDEKRVRSLVPIVSEASKQASEMERVAVDAERELDALKKAEFMQQHIGEVFEGIISSVTNFGLFVELPNTIEGLVHITSLYDDYYVYDERYMTLIGERTGKKYALGEKIRVLVSNVNLDSREIFFEVEEEEN